MEFSLFILVTALLYLRPTDFIPELEGYQLYLVAISVCTLLSWDRLCGQFSFSTLRERPIGAFAIGILVVAVVSNLLHGKFETAFQFGIEFTKVLVFYFLMTGLVNSSSRLRWFLNTMVLIELIVVGLALLNFYRIIDLPAFNSSIAQTGYTDPATGEPVILLRLSGTGSYGDPNDFCELIVPALIFSLRGLSARPYRFGRLLWLGPIVVCGIALRLTQSRGGFIGLLAGLAVLFWARYGRKKAVLLAVLVLPVIFMVFGGRQTSLSTSEGTGQARIQLWDVGFEMLKRSPLLGSGTGELAETAGHVAHNSFVQTYTELGFIGGTLYFGMFYYAILMMARLGAPGMTIGDPEVRAMRPFILAALASYTFSEFSLTHPHAVQTYAILGLATVCLHQARPQPPLSNSRLDARLLSRVVLFSAVFLTALYVWVRISVRY